MRSPLLWSLEGKLGRRPRLNTFWHGGPLGWLERACLSSMIANGHDVRLFAYEPIENVPLGVRIGDADQIVPKSAIFRFDGVMGDQNIGSLAPFSDLFRYRMLQKEDGLWVDTDAYFLRPLRLLRRHVFAWESRNIIGTGILGMPRRSRALRTLTDIMSPPFEIPPWVSDEIRIAALEKLDGRPFHPGALRYASYGPPAVTWALKQEMETGFALAQSVFYPVPFKETDVLCLPEEEVVSGFGRNVVSVHLYGSIVRKKIKSRPPEGSFLDRVWKEGTACNRLQRGRRAMTLEPAYAALSEKAMSRSMSG